MTSFVDERETEINLVLSDAIEEAERFKEDITYTLNEVFHRPFLVESRVKEADKIRLKCAYNEEKYNEPFSAYDIKDIVGIRIIVDTEDDIREVRNILSKTSLPVDDEIDTITSPRESGFRAIALYYYPKAGDYCPVHAEVQIMTREMAKWVNETHEEYDQRKYGHIKR